MIYVSAESNMIEYYFSVYPLAYHPVMLDGSISDDFIFSFSLVEGAIPVKA